MPTIEFEGIEGRFEIDSDNPDDIEELYQAVSQSKTSSVANALPRSAVEIIGDRVSGFARGIRALGDFGFSDPERTMTDINEPREFTPEQRSEFLQRDPVFQLGKDIRQGATEAYPVNPLHEGDVLTQVFSGLGSVAAVVPEGIVGGPVAVGLSYGLSAGEQGAQRAANVFEQKIAEAEAKGDKATAAELRGKQFDAEQTAFMINAPIGAITEGALGVAGKYSKLANLDPNKFITPILGKTAGKVTSAGIKGGVTEGLQEPTEQGLQNIGDKLTFNPEQEILEGVAGSSGIGGIVGTLVGGGQGLLGAKRGRGTVLPPFDLGPADLIPKSSAEAVVEKLTEGAVKEAPVAAAVVAEMADQSTKTPEEVAKALDAEAPPAAPVTSGQVQPDSAASIAEQLAIAQDPASTRKGVLITPQSDGYLPPIPDAMEVIDTRHGPFIYNPAKMTEEEAILAGSGTDFDGTALGMATPARPGPQSNTDLTVTTKSKNGVDDALTTVTDNSPESIQRAMAAHQAAVPGGTTSIQPAEQVIKDRQSKIEAEQLAAQRGDGLRATNPGSVAPVQMAAPKPAPQAEPIDPVVVNTRKAAVKQAISRSDFPEGLVDVAHEPGANWDVAFDSATKRFKVNSAYDTSEEAITLKLNTHEKLHFVVDGLREGGREAEALELIETIAAFAPDDLINQIHKFYAESTDGQIKEEAAAYTAQAFANHFRKDNVFQRLVKMVGRVLSKLTGNKQEAARIAAEMAAGRIHALSEEFLQQRRSGAIPPGTLIRSDPRILAPTQVFGRTEDEILHHVASIRKAEENLGAQGFITSKTPISPEMDVLAMQTIERLSDPQLKAEFAERIRDIAGNAMGPNLTKSWLIKYAMRQMGATGNNTLFHEVIARSPHCADGGRPGEGATEGGQRMRALREGIGEENTFAAALKTIEGALAVLHSKDGIGPELFDKISEAVLGAKVTLADLFRQPADSLKIIQSFNRLIELDGKLAGTGAGAGAGTGDSPRSGRDAYEARRLMNNPTEEAQREIDRLIAKRQSSDPKVLSELKKQIKIAASIKEGSDQIPNSTLKSEAFIAKWMPVFVGLEVEPSVARELAVQISADRMRRWDKLQVLKTKHLTTDKNPKTNSYYNSHIAQLAKEILAAPLHLQNDPKWREATAIKFYISKGLDEARAIAAASDFVDIFNEKLYLARFKAAELIAAKVTKDGGPSKWFKNMDRIKDGIRSGVLDPNAPFATLLAEKFGYVSPLDAKQFAELADIESKEETALPHELFKLRRRAQSIVHAGNDKAPMGERWKQYMKNTTAFWVVNTLSSIAVVTQNVLNPIIGEHMLRASFEVGRSLGRGSDAAGRIVDVFAIGSNALMKGIDEILFTARRDAYPNLHFNEVTGLAALADGMSKNSRSISNRLNTAAAVINNPASTSAEKATAVAENFLPGLWDLGAFILSTPDVVRRLFSVADNFHQTLTRDFVEGIFIRDHHVKVGMPADQARAIALGLNLSAELISEDGRKRGLSGIDLKMYIKDRMRDAALSSIEATGGSRVVTENISKNVSEIVTGNYRGAVMAKKAKDVYDKGTPIGWFGDQLSAVAEHVIGLGFHGRLLVGFIRTGYNLSETTSNWTPIGMMRLAYQYSLTGGNYGSSMDPYLKSLGSEYQRRYVAVQSIIGTMGLVGMWALLYGFKDDKNEPWVWDATAGTFGSTPDERMRMEAAGVKYGTLFQRNKITGEIRSVAFSKGPLEMMKYHGLLFGTFRDLERQGKLDMKDGVSGEEVGLLLANFSGGLAMSMRNFGLGSLGDLKQRFSTNKDIAKFAASSLNGFTLFSGAVGSVRRLLSDKPATDTLRSAFYSQLAYAPPSERFPALNWLGQPVRGPQEWTTERAASESTMAAFPFGIKQPSNDPAWPIYRMMIEKGATPTIITIGKVETDVGRPLSQAEFYEFTKAVGTRLRVRIQAQLPGLQRLTTKDLNRDLDQMSREEVEAVERELFLGNRAKYKKPESKRQPFR